MKKPLIAALALLGAASQVCGAPAPVAPEFVWGVSGHTFGQEAYREAPVGVSIADQLRLVQELGARWYRVDWPKTALEKQSSDYDSLVLKATRRGLKLLPILFPDVDTKASNAQIEAASFRYGREMAARYKQVSHWELLNERDIEAMIQKGEKTRDDKEWPYGTPDGDKPEHYEEGRYQKIKAQIAGLSRGVKAGNAEAKTMVDCAGWLHYGFFERLIREDKVPFDILAWHWYSEMGDMTKVRGNFNVLEKLKSYGKPIWITEINRRGGSIGGKEAEHAKYLGDVARQMRAYPGVEGFFAYELLDEPYFGADNPESHFGLVTIAKTPKGQWKIQGKKPAFSELQSIIARSASGK